MTFPVIIFTKVADAQHHYLQIFCNLNHIEKKQTLILWIEIDLHPSVKYGVYQLIYMHLTNTQHLLVELFHQTILMHNFLYSLTICL